MESMTIAVDLAKQVFEVAVSEVPGKISKRRRLSRSAFLRFIARQQPSVVVMEACGSSNYWHRRLTEFGHLPVMLPPDQVRPYRRYNKTDRTDAKALLEAYRNEEILPVPPRSVAQQGMLALHRIRSGYMRSRVARANCLRGILRELGYTIPQGEGYVVPRVTALIDDPESEVPEFLFPVLEDACVEIRELNEKMAGIEKQLRILAKGDPLVRRLRTIPGIGLLTATAMVAYVVDVQRFRSCRAFASYFGLTPREMSSGGRRFIGRISKRGDRYIRTLLMHGARSVLQAAKRQKEPDRFRSWALSVKGLRGYNKATAAVANKMARYAWAIWKREEVYVSQPSVVSPAA